MFLENKQTTTTITQAPLSQFLVGFYFVCFEYSKSCQGNFSTILNKCNVSLGLCGTRP